MFNDNYYVGSVAINDKYIFFWNNQLVFYFNLKDTKDNDLMRLTTLNFVVDPELKDTFIITVRTGSNPEKIAIVINQSATQDAVIVWDVFHDLEISSIDVGKNSNVFYDANGDTYVTENDEVLICD